MLLSVEIILLAIALGLLIPCAFLGLECLAALLSERAQRSTLKTDLADLGNSAAPDVKTAVLVPAHNEAASIEKTLETLLPQVAAPESIVVIADNCTDDTAAIARQYGVTVIERQDSQRWGKGYALDYGLQHLEANPPEVVILVDADCSVAQGTIDRIARLAKFSDRPIQATYLMEQPANPGSKEIISTLAVTVKNLVRPYGLLKLGFPCLLTGSGMAFPWQVIRLVSLANSKATDDIQLGIDLALAGHPPLYCPQGQVMGRLMGQASAKRQRSRWEHVHLETLLTQTPRLIRAAIAQRRYELLALTLELCIPPLSLLVVLWLAATGSALLTTFLGASWLPLLILGAAGLIIAASILGAWAKFSRAEIPATALLAMPFYLLWKIPLYFAFLIRPQTMWRKTERDPEPDKAQTDERAIVDTGSHYSKS
ncbi:MAG: glycosyltransferase [Hydrococcus sp. C42_A2020_068]|nr:glycosyltransferase [Hydrococcus sp. C42_A2020_068]